MSSSLAATLRASGYSVVEAPGARERARNDVEQIVHVVKMSKSISATIAEARRASIEPAVVLDEDRAIYVMNEGGTGLLWARVESGEVDEARLDLITLVAARILDHVRSAYPGTRPHNADRDAEPTMSDEEFLALEEAPIRKSRAVSEKE